MISKRNKAVLRFFFYTTILGGGLSPYPPVHYDNMKACIAGKHSDKQLYNGVAFIGNCLDSSGQKTDPETQDVFPYVMKGQNQQD